MTVAEMLGRMSGDEFTEWRAAYKLEPWGDTREDLRAGMVACAIVRALVKTDLRPEDFLMKFGPPEKMDMGLMRMMLSGLAEAAAANRRPGDPPPRRPRRRA